jgi:hypothetical protein
VDYRYTRRQVARGARPDATDGGAGWYLMKLVSELHLTYQIRVLTFAATRSGARLTIRVPRPARLSAPLRAFVKEHKGALRVERIDS